MNSGLTQLKGFEVRPQQEAMHKHLEHCFDNNLHAMVEAGTGVGKSLAYLMPAIEWARKNNKKIIVSTYTKALQEQLMDKELPRLRKLPGIDFQYALCLGSNNFLCKRRLNNKKNLPELYASPKDKEESAKIAQWGNSTSTGLFIDLPFEVGQKIWNQYNRDSDLCMRHK